MRTTPWPGRLFVHCAIEASTASAGGPEKLEPSLAHQRGEVSFDTVPDHRRYFERTPVDEETANAWMREIGQPKFGWEFAGTSEPRHLIGGGKDPAIESELHSLFVGRDQVVGGSTAS